MKNTLQLIGEWFATMFNKIESIFATKKELENHDKNANAHGGIRSDLEGIKNGTIAVGSSEYAEKLGNAEDFYTKHLLDQKIDGHVNDIEYNPETATFIFTFEDGRVKEIDTPLENTVKDGRFDEETNELVLVLVSDQEIRIPVSKFVQQDIAPVVLNATIATNENGDKTYALANGGEQQKFVDYFKKNKSIPVILKCVSEEGGNDEIYSLVNADILGIQHSMYFQKIDSSYITKLRLSGMKSSSGSWTMNPRLVKTEISLQNSEYKFDRYYPGESFDMNDWIESGGIAAKIWEADEEYEACVGTNIPEGFTDFYGYVLQNQGGGPKRYYCSIQVVTDAVLKKTMMRSSYPIDRKIEWTPWIEIGGNKDDTSSNTLMINLDELSEYEDIKEDEAIHEALRNQIKEFDFEKPCQVIMVDINTKYVCDNVWFMTTEKLFTLNIGIPLKLKNAFYGDTLKIKFNRITQLISGVGISTDNINEDAIFLVENGDGMINAVDKGWSEFEDKVVAGETPVVYLKTKDSGIYVPASYMFAKNEETNKFPGKIEITYYKTIGEQKRMFVETLEFTDSPSLSPIYTRTLSQMPVGDFVIEITKTGDNYSVANPSILPDIIEAAEKDKSLHVVIKDGNDYVTTEFFMDMTGGISLFGVSHILSSGNINLKIYTIALSGASTPPAVMVMQKGSVMLSDDIHLVSEYPEFLANYPDGSIFIKTESE